MKIYGIDFTSRPSRKKPITGLVCELDNGTLRAETFVTWDTFKGFENMLRQPGPWLAAIDFPFGQSRRFIENSEWPQSWAQYVRHAGNLSKEEFIAALEDYKRDRPMGDKEHRRQTDKYAKSISPQKLYGVPVAKMFFEGAPRLVEAGVTVPGLQTGDPQRIVVEAYPGVLARSLVGKRGYKSDTKSKQSPEQRAARQDIFFALKNGAARARFGIDIEAPTSMVDDPTGDTLDTLLCALQAAWAWSQRHKEFGMPEDSDLLEGWIADPMN
jgi:hypothetical protein